jgi:hypothetical protein
MATDLLNFDTYWGSASSGSSSPQASAGQRSNRREEGGKGAERLTSELLSFKRRELGTMPAELLQEKTQILLERGGERVEGQPLASAMNYETWLLDNFSTLTFDSSDSS